MKIRSIDLDDEENPSTVTVTMSLEEAGFIAAFTGQLNYSMADDILPRSGEVSDGIYGALVDNVFNRFYDDGVNEWKRKR